MRGNNLLGVAFRLVGLAFAGIAIVVAVAAGVFVAQSRAVSGTVIEHAVIDNSIRFGTVSGSGLLYYPVVSYQLNGEWHEFTGRRGRARPDPDKGDEVLILVSESRPPAARMNTTMGVWGSSIILGGLAALFLLLSVLAPLGFGGTKPS